MIVIAVLSLVDALLPGVVECPYCGTALPSRNKLYAHLRASTECGSLATADGTDSRRNRGSSHMCMYACASG